MYLQYQHFSESVKRYFQVVRETWCIQVPISRGRYSSELCLAWSYLPHCLYPVELIEVTFVLCQVRRLKLSILRQIHSCQPSQTGWNMKRNETLGLRLHQNRDYGLVRQLGITYTRRKKWSLINISLAM